MTIEERNSRDIAVCKSNGWETVEWTNDYGYGIVEHISLMHSSTLLEEGYEVITTKGEMLEDLIYYTEHMYIFYTVDGGEELLGLINELIRELKKADYFD